MTKLCFLGDRHVSQRSPRYRHALDVWNWAIDDAIKAGATHIIGLGDVCEGMPAADELYQLAELYSHAKARGAHVYEVAGNHEGWGSLAWLQFLGVDVAWDRFLNFHLGECILILAPYCRKGRPPFEDLDAGTIVETNQAAAQRLADHVQSIVRPANRPVIVAGHWTVDGARTGAHDYEIHSATEMVVPRAAFDGCSLVVTGHIHAAQELAPNVVIAGSLYRTAFDEAESAKSYTMVTIDQGHVSWERRLVPAREMIVQRLNWQGPTAATVAANILAMQAAGREVKVVVEIREDQLATFDPEVFAAIRDVAALFVWDKQTIPVERTRAPQIAKATTLAEQLATWLDATDQRPEPPRLERLMVKTAEVQA